MHLQYFQYQETGCHLPAGIGKGPKNLREVLSNFSWGGLVPRAWVLLVVSGQERCGPANDVRLRGRLADSGPRGPIKVPVTSGGDWRNCNRSGWWPLQILPPSHLSNAVLGFLANDNGADRWLQACSTYSRGRVCGIVFFVGSSMTNIERGCKPQYSSSGGSPVLGLELLSSSLELLRVALNYRECCVFVLTLYFCLNQVVLSKTQKYSP